MDTSTTGALFKAVWNAFPNDITARERIYKAIDAEISRSGSDDSH